MTERSFSRVFPHRGTDEFAGLTSATQWLRERGFSIGPNDISRKIGVMHGDVRIAKSRNLDAEERADLHGYLTPAAGQTFRRADVVLEINPEAPSSALEAFWADPSPRRPPAAGSPAPGPLEMTAHGSGATCAIDRIDRDAQFAIEGPRE